MKAQRIAKNLIDSLQNAQMSISEIDEVLKQARRELKRREVLSSVKSEPTKQQKILFINDSNGREAVAFATLVEVRDTSVEAMRALESNQPMVGMTGGDWKRIMIDGEIEHRVLKTGRLTDFTKSDYDVEFKVAFGNY